MARQKTKKVTTKKIPTIFVQIAAYRDPELINTLRDCFSKATNPKSVIIGIAWQHNTEDKWDTLKEFTDNPQVKILDIDYKDAKGPCWARYKLNQMYNGETYVMQLDSHHRFAEGWDTILIEMLESLRSKKCPKPLLSSYLPSFVPANDPDGRIMFPWIMEFDRFAPEGPVHFLPHTIDNFKELDKPVPARFISGHFIFADGSFVKDVPYDPTYYFHGEEINLSVRAYMAGYDLFAPHKLCIWHEYTRNGKSKHWDDHTDWPELDVISHRHNRELLGIDNNESDKKLHKHKRTLRDYEKYAGLEFSTRRAHKLTLEKKIPPVSTNDIEHQAGLTYFRRMCIDVYKPSFTEKDYNVWAVAFMDENGEEVARIDADENEIRHLLQEPYEVDKFIHIWRNFYSDKAPVSWVVWPHSMSKGWQERITGTFKTS